MKLTEFSAEFDLLYNNIMSNIAPGLTEYEKSVFLTQAQEQLIVEIYSGQYKGEPFENSEEVREYLQALIHTEIITPEKLTSELPDKFEHYQARLNVQNFWFVIFESATLSGNCPCADGRSVVVKPVSYDTYWSISRDPFKGPNQNRVLRMNREKDLMELISKYELKEYVLKYLGRPNPIILEDIPNNMTINGVSAESDCELPDVLHRTILIRAVQLAKSVWGQTQEQQ